MADQKLWDKGIDIDGKIEKFTIGKDRELDVELAEFDVLGSLAHIKMLKEQGLISEDEYPEVKSGLIEVYKQVKIGAFSIDEHVEDVHSQVEILLGQNGGRIHTGRSRNDQVLLDLKLFYRKKLDTLMQKLSSLSYVFLDQAEEYSEVLMPGYTHTQVAMTSSFGMWFTAFGEAFKEDVEYMSALFPLINKNPLGSAAGYGSSFPLNRSRTTELLGFEQMHINPINAQYGRGKSELMMAQAITNVCLSINKLATDMILYSNENYRFITLPPALTTGSSIMPHKKNPDVFELIRAYSNSLLNLPNQITLIISNLTTGYHRDFQLLKEYLFPGFGKLEELLDIIAYTLPRMKISSDLVDDEKYAYLLSVDAVNELVQKGVPFREAYLKVGRDIENGSFVKPGNLQHTHEGSLGNLGIETIRMQLKKLEENNPYRKIEDILSKLLSD
jgi:argininosuccinate lyase